MSMPASSRVHSPSLAEPTERHDMLRTILDWIADRFAEAPEIDDSIAWEDGEEHDEPIGPSTL